MNPEDRALGWRRDLEDRAETRRTAMLITFASIVIVAAPAEIDHRGWLRIEDQGRQGSCTGHAITTVQEVLAWIVTGVVNQFSRMFGYLAGQKMDGLLGRDDGATINGSVKGAKTMGCCFESTFPYPQNYSPQIPQKAVDEARPNLIRNHAVIRNYDDAYKWLATGTGAIEIGIGWTSSMAQNKSGIIRRADLKGQVLGGHALAVVGYSTRKDERGRNYLWLVNSHSPAWGNKGFAEVEPACFDDWGADNEAEMTGLTDLGGIAASRNVPVYTNLIA